MHEVNSARRQLAKVAHPDVGGTDAQMAELNAAVSEARRELQEGATKKSEKGDAR